MRHAIRFANWNTLYRLTYKQQGYKAKRSNIRSRDILTSGQTGIDSRHTKKLSTLHGTGKFVSWSPETASEPRSQPHESSKHVALCVEHIFYLTLRSHLCQCLRCGLSTAAFLAT